MSFESNFDQEYQQFRQDGGTYWQAKEFLSAPARTDAVLTDLASGRNVISMGDNYRDAVESGKFFSKAVSILLDELTDEQAVDFAIGSESDSVNLLELAYFYDTSVDEVRLKTGKNTRMVAHFHHHAATHATRLAGHYQRNGDLESMKLWESRAEETLALAERLAAERGDGVEMFQTAVTTAKYSLDKAKRHLRSGFEVTDMTDPMRQYADAGGRAYIHLLDHQGAIVAEMEGKDLDQWGRDRLERTMEFYREKIFFGGVSTMVDFIVGTQKILGERFIQRNGVFDHESAQAFHGLSLNLVKLLSIQEGDMTARLLKELQNHPDQQDARMVKAYRSYVADLFNFTSTVEGAMGGMISMPFNARGLQNKVRQQAVAQNKTIWLGAIMANREYISEAREYMEEIRRRAREFTGVHTLNFKAVDSILSGVERLPGAGAGQTTGKKKKR